MGLRFLHSSKPGPASLADPMTQLSQISVLPLLVSPPIEDFPVPSIVFPQISQKIVTRRFVFDASKDDALKAKVASASVQQPTRVEAVTALVWKCAVTSSRSYALGTSPAPSPRTYALTGAVNLRPRLMPPLPKYAFGNVSGLLWAMLDNNKDEIIDLPDLVCQLRKGIE